jgi:cephalosporin hydroxylase
MSGNIRSVAYAQQGFEEVEKFNNEFLNKIDKNIFLEIGVANGGSSKMWEECGFKRGIGVDLSNSIKTNITIKYDLVLGDSITEETINKVKNILNGELVDFLFIDGCHAYYYCKEEFNLYKQFVKKGGVIAFHDLILCDKEVEKFFDEIKDNYKEPQKIIVDYYGIGAFIYE